MRQPSARLSRRALWFGLAGLTCWCALQWFIRRQPQIVDDLSGWRQADTQTIARFFWRDGVDLLHPRISWGGDGPGYVEAELQLYPMLVALVMKVVGYAEWPGQALSLLAMMLAYVVLFRGLARRFGAWPALFASGLLICSKGTVLISTCVQPDPLAFLLAVIGWESFTLYLENEESRWLCLASLATALAGLVKPTMLAIGVAQFVLVLLDGREHLRRPAVWLAWAVPVVALAAYLLHARQLYLVYGNTFGILSGGDSKTPRLGKLFSLSVWTAVLKNNVLWGTGLPALAAGAWLALRRQIRPAAWALLAGNVAMLLVAFRYVSMNDWGAHYHLVAVPLAAHLLAQAGRDLIERIGESARPIWILTAIGFLIAGLQYSHAAYRFRTMPSEPEKALGLALAGMVSAGDLLVVRARSFSHDDDWGTPNNFEDPRVFYLSDTRGWVVANDQPEPARIEARMVQGARYYVEPCDRWHRYPEVSEWLAKNASLAWASDAGSIWRLHGLARPR